MGTLYRLARARISPNFPGLSSDPGDLPKVSDEARDHFAKWRNQWTKRLDCLPDGRWKFLCTVHPLRFRGKSTIWHGTALMCMNDEKQFKAMDEVRALTQDAGNEFWNTQFLYPDDVCPSQEWEQKRPLLAQKVRNPSLSLFIFPVSGHWGDKTFFDAVRAMAAWIDKWPDVNRSLPCATGATVLRPQAKRLSGGPAADDCAGQAGAERAARRRGVVIFDAVSES